MKDDRELRGRPAQQRQAASQDRQYDHKTHTRLQPRAGHQQSDHQDGQSDRRCEPFHAALLEHRYVEHGLRAQAAKRQFLARCRRCESSVHAVPAMPSIFRFWVDASGIVEHNRLARLWFSVGAAATHFEAAIGHSLPAVDRPSWPSGGALPSSPPIIPPIPIPSCGDCSATVATATHAWVPAHAGVPFLRPVSRATVPPSPAPPAHPWVARPWVGLLRDSDSAPYGDMYLACRASLALLSRRWRLPRRQRTWLGGKVALRLRERVPAATQESCGCTGA